MYFWVQIERSWELKCWIQRGLCTPWILGEKHQTRWSSCNHVCRRQWRRQWWRVRCTLLDLVKREGVFADDIVEGCHWWFHMIFTACTIFLSKSYVRTIPYVFGFYTRSYNLLYAKTYFANLKIHGSQVSTYFDKKNHLKKLTDLLVYLLTYFYTPTLGYLTPLLHHHHHHHIEVEVSSKK